MCSLADYQDLELFGPWRSWVDIELAEWHDTYLPIPEGGTVLDVGAGCGETVRFYLLHGAGHVIAIEGQPEAAAVLRRNFGDDPRVTIVERMVDKVKLDIEGAEENMDLEVHFPSHWETLRDGGTFWQQRLICDGPNPGWSYP